MKRLLRAAYEKFVAPRVQQMYFNDLIRSTRNFTKIKWLGYPVWQNVLDLWTVQEVIADIKPELLIECGTNKGGSARFYAHLFDLMGKGAVLTIDVEKMHELVHPRITFLQGSSVSEDIVAQVKSRVTGTQGPVMVILDSDHSEQNVLNELWIYDSFVTNESYCLVQDGVIDTLPVFKASRPGPLPAIERFLAERDDFLLRQDLCSRFLITHHPKGWLQRRH